MRWPATSSAHGAGAPCSTATAAGSISTRTTSIAPTRWFARHGDWAVLICRLIPLLRALINFPAGVAHMPIGRFLLFSVLGSLPWNAALLLGGIALGANYEALYHAIRPFEIVIYVVVVIGIAVVIALWLRGRDRNSEAREGG